MRRVDCNKPSNLPYRIAARLFDGVHHERNSWVADIFWTSTSGLYGAMHFRDVQWVELEAELREEI